METKTLNVFKIEYYWYEEDHEETFLAKDVEQDTFEKELIEAKNFAESLIGTEIKEGEWLGRGYSVDCLPEYYKQIIWFLLNKMGYVECCLDEYIKYDVGDHDVEEGRKIIITRCKEKTERSELG